MKLTLTISFKVTFSCVAAPRKPATLEQAPSSTVVSAHKRSGEQHGRCFCERVDRSSGSESMEIAIVNSDRVTVILLLYEVIRLCCEEVVRVSWSSKHTLGSW